MTMRMSVRVLRHVIAGCSLGVCVGTAAMAADAGPPEPDLSGRPLTAAEQADMAQLKHLLTESLNSSNMRIRVMVGRTIDPTRENLRHPLTPIDTLAEQIRGSTDPMVLALMVDVCDDDRLRPKPTCDAVDIATRWTVADAQNQVAWLTLASTLRMRGETAGEVQAFQRAARASTWHEFSDDVPRVVLNALPASLGPFGRVAVLQLALTSAAAYVLPNDALMELNRQCKNADLHDDCVRILDTIDHDDSSLVSKSIGVRIGKTAGYDLQTVADRTRKLDALYDAASRSDWKELVDLTDPGEQTVGAETLRLRIALGEVAWARKLRVDSGLTESAAADRYRAETAARMARATAASRAAGN